MINNFGQTPCKLFNRPHPLRDVLNLPNYYLTQFDGNASRLKLVFESKLKAPISKLEISSKMPTDGLEDRIAFHVKMIC